MKLDRFGTAGDLQELLSVRDSIDNLLAGHDSAKPDGLTPRIDLVDLGEALQLTIDVPGVSQSDLELAVNDGELVIAGLRETLPQGPAVIVSERPSGPFQRSIALPTPVDRENATAHLTNGVLVVTLPKLAEA
ncbi:MAG: Hsp20/alpha crystallin family protein [Trueperaceae bacterium]|nr:Hsp20/alpha crystallin family protein [Trueperaceae bacterium]